MSMKHILHNVKLGGILLRIGEYLILYTVIMYYLSAELFLT